MVGRELLMICPNGEDHRGHTWGGIKGGGGDGRIGLLGWRSWIAMITTTTISIMVVVVLKRVCSWPRPLGLRRGKRTDFELRALKNNSSAEDGKVMMTRTWKMMMPMNME